MKSSWVGCVVSAVAIALSGCGGSGKCAGNACASARYRQAVPSVSSLTIQVPPGAVKGQGLASARQGLGEPSADLAALADYIAGINDSFQGVVGAVNALAAGEPSEQQENLYAWRQSDPDVPGMEDLLIISTEDDTQFAFHFWVGEPGFAPGGPALVSGSATLSGDVATDVEILLDYDAITAVDPSVNATGSIVLALKPWSGGDREVWYDHQDFSINGSTPTTSQTTYWVFSDGSGALEYLSAVPAEASEALYYARWSVQGGRSDVAGAYLDATYGDVQGVGTSCWSGHGANTFDAYVEIDAANNFYGSVQGAESDCVFGRIDGHPRPSGAFDSVPQNGEWATIAASL